MEPHVSSLYAQQFKAVCLAVVAGYVDGYALRVFNTYASFMSGNTTFAGMMAGQGHLMAALSPGLAIAGFLGGSFTGNWFIQSGIHSSRRLLFAASAMLLAAFMILNLHAALNPNVGIPILSLAMGMMNPALSHIGGEPVSLTFVTGTLNKIGSHLALAIRHTRPPDAEGAWDNHLSRALLEAGLWTGFLTGAILSGVVAPHFGALELIPASVALIAFAFFSSVERTTSSRQTTG
jgi:uncharacterized membrane protein YoaK (UPF0700 family)